MNKHSQLLLMISIFAAAWFLPVNNEYFMKAIGERLKLLRWYARKYVLVSLVIGTGCNGTVDANEKKIVQAPAKAASATERIDKVTVNYFHNTRRCPTCLGIQKGIEETIDAKFTKDIEAGMLEFHELNMEEDQNKIFLQQFKLSFSTMIVAAHANDETIKWETAGKVWDFAHSPDELKSYVEKMIQQQLDAIGRTI